MQIGSLEASYEAYSDPFLYFPSPRHAQSFFGSAGGLVKRCTISVEEVITEGRPGDLLVILGDNVSSSHPSVFCELQHDGVVLERLMRVEKSRNTFITRIPEDATPGEYTLQVSEYGWRSL